MKTPLIIGLTGKAGAGKDTVSEIICSAHQFAAIGFADPIRRMIFELFCIASIPNDHIFDRTKKEQIIPALGVSYRHMAQDLGTKWGQELAPDFWIKIAEKRILERRKHRNFQRFCISDVRFPREAAWVRSKGGVIWQIDRPGIAPVRAHVSEQLIDQITPDQTIINDGSVDDLRLKVTALAEQLLDQNHG